MRTSPLLTLFVAAMLCVSLNARTQVTQDDARRLAREAEQRIRQLQTEADRLAAQTSTLLGELRRLQLERDIRGEQLKKADAELAAITAALAQTSERLAHLEAQRVADTPGVHDRLVEIYKRGRGGYLRLLLGVDDVRSLGRMTRGVAAIAQLDRLRFEEHRRTVLAEREAIAELQQRKAALATAQADAAKARSALDVAVAAHNRRLDDLDRQRDLAARYVGELQNAATELQRRVSGMSSDAPATLPLAPFRGTLAWPVSGRIVSRFGRNPAGRFGTAIVRNGIEIAPSGSPDVRAVHGGTVAFAAPFTGFGTLVIVDHGAGAFTLYGHLAHAAVPQGTRIERGAFVGRAGRNTEGDEVVYFEVRIDGRPVDPVQWLRSPR